MDENSDGGWLSTRNKSRIESKPKLLRRRSGLPKKPRQLGEFVLTQSPPPEQLFKATKQSHLTNFFKPQNKEIKDEAKHYGKHLPVTAADVEDEHSCLQLINEGGGPTLGEVDISDQYGEKSNQTFNVDDHNLEETEKDYRNSHLNAGHEDCVKNSLEPSKKRKCSESFECVYNEKKVRKNNIQIDTTTSDEDDSTVKKLKRHRTETFEFPKNYTKTNELKKQATNKKLLTSLADNVSNNEYVKNKIEYAQDKLLIYFKSDHNLQCKGQSAEKVHGGLHRKSQKAEREYDSLQLIESQKAEREYDSLQLESQKVEREYDSLQLESQKAEREYDSLQLESQRAEKENDSLQFESQKNEKEYESLQLKTQKAERQYDSLQSESQTCDNLKFKTEKNDKDYDSLPLESQFTFQSQRDYYDALERDMAVESSEYSETT